MLTCEDKMLEVVDLIEETLKSSRDHIENAKKLQEGIKLRIENMASAKMK